MPPLTRGGSALFPRLRELGPSRGLEDQLVAGEGALAAEDLHHLDAASRALLAFLARTLGERRVVLVGSYQPDALGRWREGRRWRRCARRTASRPVW